MRYLVLFLIVLLASAIDNPRYDTLFNSFPQNKQFESLRQDEKIFKQVVDHYDYRKATYFDQRYFVISDYFDPKEGPVFLYICGENVCKGVPQTRTWVVNLAMQLRGLILVVQHRFYGKSLPFGKDSFSIQNLAFLNSQQALRDYAYFIEQIKQTNLYGVSNNPWISVGGSYPGALSAWFRYKYPHLVIGALASSAVVNAIQDFNQFDQQIYFSSQRSGQWCTNALNASVVRVEQIIYSSESEANTFKAKFQGGQKLSNQEFLFYWADAIVLTIQYGGRSALCGQLEGKSSNQQFEAIVSNAKKFPVQEYGSFYLKNQTLAYQTMSPSRPWYYQYCTEYGWFQTFSPKHPMRSKKLDLLFFSKFCQDAFGKDTWPKVDRKNVEYGALNQRTNKIIFSNGIQDPWRWASLQENVENRFLVQVIDCPNCAHCVDLYTPIDKDSDTLKIARENQFKAIGGWVSEYWGNRQQQQSSTIVLNTK